MQFRRLLGVLALALGLTLSLLLALGTAQAAPTASTRYVATTGQDLIGSSPPYVINNCLNRGTPCRTVQYAVGWADAGDTIYVAGGVYTSGGAAVITVTKSITLYGGWNGAASGPLVRDPVAYPTTLDGERVRRVVYIGNAAPTIAGFIIANGWCSGTMNDVGGGVYVNAGAPVIAGNVITDNFARNYGGGLYAEGATLVLTANDVLSNRVTYGGGGLYLSEGVAWLHGNRIADNRASYGGGVEVDHTTCTATANLLVNNQANSAWMISGMAGRARLVNNVVANNNGAAVRIYQYRVEMVHNTIAFNGDRAVEGWYTATLTLTNNIIAHNHRGVSTILGSQAAGDYNLFWQNPSNSFTGTHAIVADPRLAPDGYHLGPGSAAMDAATNAGVTDDVDGDRRPIGPAPDIGADERRIYVQVPLVLRNF